jgi:hypothetical protein
MRPHPGIVAVPVSGMGPSTAAVAMPAAGYDPAAAALADVATDIARVHIAAIDDAHLPALAGLSGGGIKSGISDLTHNQPQPRCHDREDFVPGGDFSSLWSAILS